MLHTLYRNLTPFLGPLLKPYLYHRVKKGKEDPNRLNERFGYTSLEKPQGRLIWLHAASVGEATSALPLIKRLSDEANILVTTGTTTSAQLMAEKLPAKAFHQYLPLDHPKWIARFLDFWQPDAALWLESELWPNTLYAIKQRSIPAILVNARMSEKSVRRWQKYPGLAHDILSCFDLILAQNEQMAEHIRNLGHKNTDYVGNLKFASAPLDWDENALKDLKEMIGKRPLWLVASTHEGEEDIAMETHKKLQEVHENLLTILIPRHPKRADEILLLAKEKDLSIAQRSAGETIDPKTDIYLADTMGEMGLFYKLAPLLTMGGSFIPDTWGGHNIIEPAHLDCAITYGPIMYNHIDSKQALEQANGAMGVQTPEALYQTIDHLLNNPAKVEQMQKNAKDVVTNSLTVIDAITDRVLKRIQRTAP